MDSLQSVSVFQIRLGLALPKLIVVGDIPFLHYRIKLKTLSFDMVAIGSTRGALSFYPSQQHNNYLLNLQKRNHKHI